jgi:hypothetical protein
VQMSSAALGQLIFGYFFTFGVQRLQQPQFSFVIAFSLSILALGYPAISMIFFVFFFFFFFFLN